MRPLIPAALAALAAAYLLGVRRLAGRRRSLLVGARRVGAWRVGSFLAGLATVAFALLPPYDTLADERFAAHMGQHMLLIVVAAPLLAAGGAGTPLVLAAPRQVRPWLARRRLDVRRSPATAWLFLPATAWLASVAALWIWHLPGPYDAAVRSGPIHACEHVTFLLTAWLFWWHLLRPDGRRLPGGIAVLYVLASAAPAAALGAVLTFATHPLYPAQAAAALRSGVDPVVDQQLAALVMWVPADLVYLAVTVALFLSWFRGMAGEDEIVDADRPTLVRAVPSAEEVAT